MVSVPWDKLAKTPTVSEALVTMLVLRMHSRAQEVDGTGGDGGRDLFEFTEDGELVHYEAKSFTGRMTRSRREQVRRSLISTARYQPDHWDLLVPISPNPTEMRWFNDLRTEFPFVRDWRGLHWLDQQFAQHPDLIRYALQESGDYILERIAEARAERDVMLGGVPDLARRIEALQARGQEISPHYAIGVSVASDGETSVQLRPKSPESAERAPISFTGRFAFRANDPGEERRRKRFEDALRYGGDVEVTHANIQELTIDAPAELGISGSSVPKLMRITAHRETLTPLVKAQLTVCTPAGVPTAALPLIFSERTTGSDGGTLIGNDYTGFLNVRMIFDREAHSWQQTLSFTPPEQALPHAVVPVLQLISRARPGQLMKLTFQGDTPTELAAPIAQGLTPGGWQTDEAERWADAFDALATLQNMTRQFFPTPDDYTLRDARDVQEAVALLRGETIDLRGTTVAIGVTGEEVFTLLAASDTFALAAAYEGMLLSFGHHQVDLGPCVDSAVVDKVLNMSDARQEFERTGHATLRLRVARGRPAQRYLGRHLPGQEPTED
ncbi:hypothetical protein [Streptomyces sp. MI02-7b]|uniref:hypothetical protein n=1 Tax=Streptomyces sp. MI02-7b TaxID=462941 RepID=UPI0029A1DA74|nr:hypothetical protein [Streptomyces sp. MI02-7b]MDX3075941.1 hypothetical protein [Streptomyces sp. MI02-7b]